MGTKKRNREAIIASKIIYLLEKIAKDDTDDFEDVLFYGNASDELIALRNEIRTYLDDNKLNRYEIRERVRNTLRYMFEKIKLMPFVEKVVIDYDELNEVLFYIVPDEEV